MSALRATALAAAGLALLSAPALAKPGDAACIWNAASETAKQAFLKAYAEDRLNDADDLMDAEADALLPSCKLKPEDRYSASDALTTYGMRVGATLVLKERYKVEETRLQTFWEGLSAAERDAYTANAIEFADHKAAHLDNSLPIRAMKSLGVTDKTARVYIKAYYASGIVLPHLEAKF